MITLPFIVSIASICAIIILAATIPARKKKIKASIGSCLLPMEKKKVFYFVAILIIAPLLNLVQFIRIFDPYIHIILGLTSVLGVELAIRDKVYGSLNGVYENALIVDGRLLKRDEITAFPTLEYENESEYFNGENADFYRKSLQIVTEKSGVIFVGFASEDERNAAVEIMKDWV